MLSFTTSPLPLVPCSPTPLPLQVIYIEVEPWPNNMRYKMKCCWKCKMNTLGTSGTHKQKSAPFPPLEPFHRLHEISISKMVGHHLQPELIPPL
jgi:hypothetical protein